MRPQSLPDEQPIDKRSIIGIVRYRTLEKQLIGSELALEDVTVQEIHARFDIFRNEEL